MPEEVLFKSEQTVTKAEITTALRTVADQLESGDVRLESDAEDRTVAVPEHPLFETELERLTDSETGEQRYELEYEIRWTK
jgi:amphi-Trp domain-containing protein